MRTWRHLGTAASFRVDVPSATGDRRGSTFLPPAPRRDDLPILDLEPVMRAFPSTGAWIGVHRHLDGSRMRAEPVDDFQWLHFRPAVGEIHRTRGERDVCDPHVVTELRRAARAGRSRSFARHRRAVARLPRR